MDRGVPSEYRVEVIAGWVSVLMAHKAAVNFGVDLRNHNDARAWEQGYANNQPIRFLPIAAALAALLVTASSVMN